MKSLLAQIRVKILWLRFSLCEKRNQRLKRKAGKWLVEMPKPFATDIH